MEIGEFTESKDIIEDGAALRRRLMKDGYLFFRKLFPSDAVLNLRRQIMELCAEEGWLREGSDPMEGLTDHEPILEGEERWLPVYEKVNKLEDFHRLKLHPNVQAVMELVFEEQVFCLPRTIARIAFPRDNERITQPHQDWLYVQGSTETISCWAPMGDVPAELGGLMLLEGSHKSGFLKPRSALGPGGNTVDCDPSLHWVATDFRVGDVLFFKSLTIHAARPSANPERIRLSIDFRYVGVSHTISEEWMLPHFSWVDERFSWDNLEKDWEDESLKHYWEHEPIVKFKPHERGIYARD